MKVKNFQITHNLIFGYLIEENLNGNFEGCVKLYVPYVPDPIERYYPTIVSLTFKQVCEDRMGSGTDWGHFGMTREISIEDADPCSVEDYETKEKTVLDHLIILELAKVKGLLAAESSMEEFFKGKDFSE